MNKGWKVFAALCLSSALLLGCQEKEELGTGTVVGNENKIAFAEESNLLQLSPDELKVYTAFKKKWDDRVLKDADPIMVAKLYFHAIDTKDYATQYELFIDDLEQVEWSKQEHLKMMKEDGLKTAEQMRKLFARVQEVKFIEVDKKSGYLEFPEEGENLGQFQMVKNKKGIWKVKFRPMQWGYNMK
ncbi:hypothetical protein [Laceyella putida]|uniref:Lipoprotein n=1 Tax=Laceyella putida TaxID=110101 RepID=A0ABW2RK08_9BACL